MFLWWRGCVHVVVFLTFFCACVFGVVWLCFCGFVLRFVGGVVVYCGGVVVFFLWCLLCWLWLCFVVVLLLGEAREL